MFGFNSARNRRISAALHDLRGRQADLLALSRQDLEIAAALHGLGRADLARLLKHLITQAMERDVHRLIAHFRASGRTTMPPPRLVADWAAALGADPRMIGTLAADSAAAALAAEYLAVGKIDVQQRGTLEDVAAAYGAAPATALRWIETAVSAEIDRYVEGVRPQSSWWRRFAGSQPR